MHIKNAELFSTSAPEDAGQQLVFRSRFQKAQVDGILRKERERTLTDGPERTFAFLKPDTVHNHLAGEVLSRLERKASSSNN